MALGRLNNLNLQTLLKVSQIKKHVRIILHFHEEVKIWIFVFPPQHQNSEASDACLEGLDKLAGKNQVLTTSY